MHRYILFTSFVSALLLYILHSLAVEYSLYWTFWWYDIPMHILGGVVLGSVSVWFFFSLQDRVVKLSDFWTVSLTLITVFVGGIAWEVFEFLFGLFYHPQVSYLFDTSKDMVMDMVGAFTVLYLYQKEKLAAIFSYGK